VKIADSVIVITGGGSGIGAGLARRFIADGATAVVVADRSLDNATKVAAELGERASAVEADVTDEAAVIALVHDVLTRHGRIDLFCSNAGIPTGVGLEGGEAADRAWQTAWEVHVMAHVYAARGHSIDDCGRRWLSRQHRVGRRSAEFTGRCPVHRK
jgi:NAD(P)-dependent dehydrogenase (short-subunit alcohol dehydrogenase family)